MTQVLGNMTIEVASKSAMENLPSFSLWRYNRSTEQETTSGLRLLCSL